MKRIQKALVITHADGKAHGLDRLNDLIGNEWRVMHVAPMGGSGQASRSPLQFAAIVIIEQISRTETGAEVAVEAAIEETLEEVEENGESEKPPADAGTARSAGD